MENTGSIRFKNDEPIWMISIGDQWVGPLKPSEIAKNLDAGTFSWVQYVVKSGEKDVKRICDVELFKQVQSEAPKAPAPPAPELAKPKVIQAPRPPVEPKPWFLYHMDVQSGPLSAAEIGRGIQAQTLDEEAFVWKEGMDDWKPLKEIEPFKEMYAKATPPKRPPPPKQPSDKRKAPRKPLIAKIMIASSNELVSGICRDVSVGGMQVLTDRIPGETGDTIKLNVTPPMSTGIHPFVAEGMIVRILEDHRGFSFRFEKLSNDARNALEQYIRAGG